MNIDIVSIMECNYDLFPTIRYELQIDFPNLDSSKDQYVLIVPALEDIDRKTSFDGVIGSMEFEENKLYTTILGRVNGIKQDDNIVLKPMVLTHKGDYTYLKMNELYFYSNLQDVTIFNRQHMYYPIDSPAASNPVVNQLFELMNYVFPLENKIARNQLSKYYDYNFYVVLMSLFIDSFKGHAIRGSGLNTNLESTFVTMYYLMSQKEKNKEERLFVEAEESNILSKGLIRMKKPCINKAILLADLPATYSNKNIQLTISEIFDIYINHPFIFDLPTTKNPTKIIEQIKREINDISNLAL